MRFSEYSASATSSSIRSALLEPLLPRGVHISTPPKRLSVSCGRRNHRLLALPLRQRQQQKSRRLRYRKNAPESSQLPGGTALQRSLRLSWRDPTATDEPASSVRGPRFVDKEDPVETYSSGRNESLFLSSAHFAMAPSAYLVDHPRFMLRSGAHPSAKTRITCAR